MGNVSGCCRSSAAVQPNPLNMQLHHLQQLRTQVRDVKVVLARSVESAASIVVGVPKNEPLGTVRFHHRRGSSQMRLSAKWLREIESDIAALNRQLTGDETARAIKMKVDAQKVRQALLVADDVSRGLTASLFQYNHGTVPMPAISLPAPATHNSMLPIGVSVDIKVIVNGGGVLLPISAAGVISRNENGTATVRPFVRQGTPRPEKYVVKA